MTSSKHQAGSYASINGLNLYYEIHDSGQPLVLLPGAYMTIASMGALVPQLAETRRVIAVELQGHGHTADIPTLLLVGDGAGIQLAHAVEFFGLLGGGQGDGDVNGLSASALAVLPATTHVGWAPPHHGIITRTHLLVPILTEFLDAPLPDSM